MTTLNCKGKLVHLEKPLLMGIINATPDSFYSGSRKVAIADILAQAGKMLEEGAAFLDIGGYSTRPGATEVSLEEELQRTCPAIEAIVKEFPEAMVSIDTFRSKVALEAANVGACIVNDISGGRFDEDMLATAAAQKMAYVLMHSRGKLAAMHENYSYTDILQEVIFELATDVQKVNNTGISDVLVDPGFGFSKNIAQNFVLMKELERFSFLEKPLLVGISRKSMIWKSLEISTENALNGTSVLNTLALIKGAAILRVHDIKAAQEVIKLTRYM